MRISDWSSDVCSSDLLRKHRLQALPFPFAALARWGAAGKRAGLFGLTSFGSSVPGAGCCPGRDRPRAMARGGRRSHIAAVRLDGPGAARAFDWMRTEEQKSENQSIMGTAYTGF